MIGQLLKDFYNTTVIENRLPVNFKEKDSNIFTNNSKLNLPKSSLVLLKNVSVTDIGIIYKNLSVIKENIICYDGDFKNYRFRYFLKSHLKSKKKLYNGKKAILIFDNYTGPNGFAHWLCDGLTRLAEINDLLEEYTVIVPPYFKTQKIYSDSLKFFKITSLHYLEENSLTYFKELYFPSHIGDTGNFHPENLTKLKNIVIPKINLKNTTAKNIYISRAKAQRRFIKNEAEVTVLLAKYNFEIYCLEDYSLAEQIAIINSASNIVSIHGAALALLMFATEGSSVMELRSNTDAINNMYYFLANASKLNYYYLGCESILKTNAGNNFDLSVNLNELEENVKQMVSKNK